MKRVDYCIYFVFALLGPHFANAGWVCAEGGTEIPDAPDSVQISDDLETLTNCTYDGFPVGEEEYYFEVKAGNSYNGVDIAVGVATDRASVGGAPLKGVFYNNDVFDGNGKTLRKHFGDVVRPKRNNEMSTVGVLVKKNEGGVTLYLLHDGVRLGPALTISNPGSVLYPAALANGEATIQFLPRETGDLPDKPLERSGDIINNLFRITSLTEGTEPHQCSSEQIRLWPVGDHDLKTKYDSQIVSFYVGFVSEDADNSVGYLTKTSGQEWEWTENENEDDHQHRSECLKIAKSVFKDATSFTFKESKITVSSKTGKSLEAMQSEFPTVAQDGFESSD